MSDAAPPPEPPEAAGLVRALREASTTDPWAVLLFGSRLAGTDPDPHSAYDLVWVVDAYRPFYDGLHASGSHRRSPAAMALLSRALAPNVIAFDPGLPGGEIAKVMILTRRDLERGLSPDARDHFLHGRLIQRVAVLSARDDGARERLRALLEGARDFALQWTSPWLPARFSPEAFARRMLAVSYRGEVRPESSDRAAAVFEAQRGYLVGVAQEVLERAHMGGRVEAVDDASGADGPETWRLKRRPGVLARARWRLYFLRSAVRATLRWLKHTYTFDDWLTYLERKVERRTGLTFDLTRLERRLPLLFLWPRALLVLYRLRREDGPGSPAGDRSAS